MKTIRVPVAGGLQIVADEYGEGGVPAIRPLPVAMPISKPFPAFSPWGAENLKNRAFTLPIAA